MTPPALPFLLMRCGPNGAPIFRPPLWTLCFLTTFSTHSLSILRLTSMFRRCSLLLQRTRSCALQVPQVCAWCGLPPVHSSMSLSHGGVIFCSLSTSSCASLLFRQSGSPAWLSQSENAMVTPLLFSSHLSRLMHFQSFWRIAPHIFPTGPFPGRLPLGCRRRARST